MSFIPVVLKPSIYFNGFPTAQHKTVFKNYSKYKVKTTKVSNNNCEINKKSRFSV